MQKTVEEILNDFNKELTKTFGLEITKAESEELQRTEDWHKKRLGMFTGSRFGDLMTCKSRAKGKDWTQKNWLIDFGDTAISYIIERAIERVTGQRIETPTTWEMRWGNEHEDEGKTFFQEVYKIPGKEFEFSLEIQEVGFINFLGNAGASPDGKIIINNEIYGFELKCPATLKNHYKYMNEPVAEGHVYFWQCQGEMLALKCDKLFFATYDPRFPDEWKIAKHNVRLSTIHANALIFRCIVGEMIVRALMKNMRINLRVELSNISDTIPEDYDSILEWMEEKRKELEL